MIERFFTGALEEEWKVLAKRGKDFSIKRNQLAHGP